MQNMDEHTSSQNDFSLCIYNYGIQTCKPGYTWGPGVRNCYMLCLVTSGKGSLVSNHQTFPLQLGDVFFAAPGQHIGYSADIATPLTYSWVGFNGTQAHALANILPFAANQPVFACQAVAQAKELLQKICASDGFLDFQQASRLGNLYLLCALFAGQKSKQKAQSKTNQQSMQEALQYIEFNYANTIGVDEIAKTIGVSRSHLYRIFMAHTGQAPIDYLTAYRIQKACHLLLHSVLNIAEIAYSVGFDDQFYFSRVFKKTKGMPPSKYK